MENKTFLHKQQQTQDSLQPVSAHDIPENQAARSM